MKAVLNKWTEAREAEIWKDAIFVFDTSVLLNFLEFLHTYRQDIYANIFPKLKGRLFVTNYAEYEFLKNKEKVLNNPKEEYRVIKEKHFPDQHLQKFINQYDQLKNVTAKENKHPYLKKEVFMEVDKGLEELKKKIKALESNMDKLVVEQLKEHSAAIEKDNLLGFFEVTPGFTYQELMKIVEEGEFRYRNKIPPGYMDEKEKAELGVAKFGDLICWKQTLILAKEKKRPVLLICDDLKEDWCLVDGKDRRKMVGPRTELMKEMKDITGVEFWAYSSPQFLFKAKEILKSNIEAGTIENAKEIFRSRESGRFKDAVMLWLEDNFKPESYTYPFNKQQRYADARLVKGGIPHYLHIKRLSGDIRQYELWKEIIDTAFQMRAHIIGFEPKSFMVVFVLDDLQTSEYVKRVAIQFEEIIVFAGYINDEGIFVEATSVPSRGPVLVKF